MEFNGDRDIAMDNMTIKWNGEQTHVFYTKYGDMMLSNVTIPFGIIDQLRKYESEVRTLDNQEEKSKYTILFLSGDRELIIPIDVIHVESLSSFMLSLKE